MNAATLAALMLCALASACSRAPQATPVPASTPQAPAVNAQQASATPPPNCCAQPATSPGSPMKR